MPRELSCTAPPAPDRTALSTELLLLPDGRILVHDLTPTFAALLNGLNPADDAIKLRANKRRTRDSMPPHRQR